MRQTQHSISMHSIITVVLFHLNTLFSSKRAVANPDFYERINRLMTDTNLCNAIVFIAMFYLTRFWHECDVEIDVDNDTQYELLVVALVISCKIHDDDRYTNLVWSEVSGIDLFQLNELEREFLEIIEYRVHVNVDVYEEMTRDIAKLN